MKVSELSKLDKNSKVIVDKLTVVATQVEVKQSSTGKNYIQFVGVDGLYKIVIKKWDASEIDTQFFQTGTVYDLIDVENSFYQGNPQIIILGSSTVTVSTTTVDELIGNDLGQKVKGMVDKIQTIIKSVSDPDCRYLLNKAFGDKESNQLFKEFPAAEGIHHSGKHGLLQHTLGVTNCAIAIAEAVISTYGDDIPVNMDIIKTSALLHDLKKIEEYSIDKMYAGKLNKNALLGHITMGQMFVHEEFVANNISEETMLQVCHCIAAHHGKLEFGSPVKPSTIEAQILSSADFADSRCKIFLENLEVMNEGDYQQKGCFGLDGARIYYPKNM